MTDLHAAEFEANNRNTWQLPATLATFSGEGTWTDPGEEAAITALADRVKDQPILDVGVGAGRTAAIFRTISEDYIGVDYTPAMVELSRHHHPDLHFEECDVRDLSRFHDQQFSLVNFSFNGIDAVPHADRAQAIAEMYRVTRVGGCVLYSTLNKDGLLYATTPWSPPASPVEGVGGGATWQQRVRQMPTAGRRVAGLLWRARKSSTPFRRSVRNWKRLRTYAEDHETWGIGVLDAHDYGVLCHFTTLRGAVEEISAAGLRLVQIYEKNGNTLSEQDISRTEWFHLFATREN